MANNRMWLVHAGTGKRVLLAKSFGAGWYPWIGPSSKLGGIASALLEAFSVEGTGDTGWHLEFEHHHRGSPPLSPTTSETWQDSDGKWHDGSRPAE